MNEILKNMIMNGDSIAAITESIREEICDHYCKYPDQYSVKENDANYDRLINEECENCPLNVL